MFEPGTLFYGSIIVALLGQLAPDAIQAAKEREIADYYARWIGVRAPELGPRVRDGLRGPTIKLQEFRDKKVLLYSFDAGNFVYGPDSSVFPENLRVLDRVRQDVGPDRFAVVGLTEGVMFFFPNVDIPDEIRQLTKFPIASSLRVRPRDAPEPYRLLARPGGIVLDRQGVIQAIFTKQMTEKQIRDALTAPDWSKPLRPAPIDDPWRGTEPPTPLRSTVERWSKTAEGVVGLARGDWDMDGVDNLLVLRDDNTFSVLTPSGDEVVLLSIEAMSRRRLAIQWCAQANGKGLLLQFRGGWPREVPVYNATGERLWSYPENDVGGIDFASWVDMDGDGLSEMLVGFSGDTGLHLVSNDGKTRWTNTYVKTRWTVAGFDAHGEQPGLALSTGVDGAIRIYDANGHQVGRIVPDGKPIVTFAAAEMTKDGDRQILFIQKATVGTVDHAVASDLEGNVHWRYPIVAFRVPRCPPAIVAADVTGDGTREWVFQCSAGEVVAVNTKGRLVGRFETPSKGPTLITAVETATGESELVALSAGSKLVVYGVSSVATP